MGLVSVLHMNGGVGDTSYANNSLLQRKVISMTKALAEEAIIEMYNTAVLPKSFCMAELGCSSGPNTLFFAKDLVKTVHQLSLRHGHRLPEFQILLNDLPGTDFNSIFQSLLPTFQTQLMHEIGLGFSPCFVSGVPGSFYTRLFAANILHFIHSSYSLMWLSKVPKGLELNKDNISVARKSPENVINAYYEQFQRDFSTFLKCRSEEVVVGGKMVLTVVGSKSENAASKECYYIWELLAQSLQEMVLEWPSQEEMRKEVEKEGSFIINKVEVSEIKWTECGRGVYSKDTVGDDMAGCMRSVAEPLLVKHFGESIIDRLFKKYKNVLSDCMSTEDTKFNNVTIILTKKD